MAIEIISRADAKSRGLVKYFTGQSCKNAHIAERRTTNGICDACYKENERRYRETHREKYREKWNRWGKNNPEKMRAKSAKWESENPDKVRIKKKNWRAANPEKLREQERRARARNPDKFRAKNKQYKIEHAERLAPIARARSRQWQIDNPEGVRRNVNARRARQHNAPGHHTTQELKDLLMRQGFLCIGCYADLSEKSARTLDNIVALSRGGSQWITNLQYLCKPCNSRKHDKTQLEWLIATAERFQPNKRSSCSQPKDYLHVER